MSREEKICTNCDHIIGENDNFCNNCGQKTDEASLKIKYFVKDYLSANFNLDSKIYQTLKLLILSPAKLTTEFLAGKKTKYISPVRLYLVISLLYFFVVSLDLSSNTSSFQNDNASTDSISVKSETDDLINLSIDNEESMSDFDRLVAKKLKLLNSDMGRFVFAENFKQSLSKGMFLLLPLIALILLLLFYKDSYYIQHFVFTLHLQSLIFVIASFSLLLEYFIEPGYVIFPELLLLYLVTFVWVKKFYKLTNKKTFWKLILFYFMLVILLIMHFSLLLIYNFSLL